MGQHTYRNKRIKKAGGIMDDYNQNNDMSKILEKAEKLKNTFSEQKQKAAQPKTAAPTEAPQDEAADKAPKVRATHLPKERENNLEDRFDEAVRRSQKTFRELFDEAIDAAVADATAELNKKHAAELADVREAAQKDRDETVDRIKADAKAQADEATKQHEADKQAAAEQAKSDADALADLKAQLAEKDEQITKLTSERDDLKVQAQDSEDAHKADQERAEEQAKADADELELLRAQVAEQQSRIDELEEAAEAVKQESAPAEPEVADTTADTTVPSGGFFADEADENADVAEEVTPQEETQEMSESTDNQDDLFFDIDDIDDLDAEQPEDADGAPIIDTSEFDDLFEEDETVSDADVVEEPASQEEAAEPETEEENPAADIGREDLVSDHSAYRTTPRGTDETLSDNIPWVMPSPAERAKQKQRSAEEAEEQAAAAAAAENSEPAPKAVDRKTEEDKNVLEVLRQLSNATPITPADDADVKNTSDVIDAAEADLFESETVEEPEASADEAAPEITDLFEEEPVEEVVEESAAPAEAEDATGIFEEPAQDSNADTTAEASQAFDDLFADDDATFDDDSLFEDEEVVDADATVEDELSEAPADDIVDEAPVEPTSTDVDNNDDFGFSFDDDDLFEEPVADNAEAVEDTAPAVDEAPVQDVAEDNEPAAKTGLSADADVAEGSAEPVQKTGLPENDDLDTTQVLDTQALESFFAVSDAEEETPSVFDQKDAETAAQSDATADDTTVDADTAEATQAFDDLFKDDEPAAAPAQPTPSQSADQTDDKPEDPFTNSEDMPNHVPGDTFNLFNDLEEARRIVNSQKSDEELLAESDNQFEALFEDEETLPDDADSSVATDDASEESHLTSDKKDIFDDLFNNNPEVNETSDDDEGKHGLFGRRKN